MPLTGTSGSGAPAPTAINLTPATDITYDGSTGVLVGNVGGGIVEGWRVRNWASFNGITESSAGYLELDSVIPGTMRLHNTGSFLRDGPGIYLPKDAYGDFDLQAHLIAPGAGSDNQMNSGVIAGRLGDAVAYDSYIAAAFGDWSPIDAKFMARVCRYGDNSTEYTGPLNGSWDRWVRISRTGQSVNWQESPDGSTWTSRVGPIDRDYVGHQFQIGIAAGGNTGPVNKMRFSKIIATFTEAI